MPFRLDCLRLSWLLVPLIAWGLPSQSSAETFTFHHENVLGTSLEIQVESETPATATVAEERVLTEIQRLSQLFSTYSATSEFSRWQADVGRSARLSPELFTVLQASDHWQQHSGGAFNPAAEAFSKLWRAAEQRNQLPSAAELSAVVSQVNQPHWSLDAKAGLARHLTVVPLTLNAIAKGAIVDQACQVALKIDGVHGVTVNIGGDLRVCGEAVQQVRIANPTQDAVNAPPIATIFLNNRAVATSGNYRRGFNVAGQWYSHIIDPRTGKPTSGVISATVVADKSTDADALATILNVLPVEKGLALVESLADIHCLIVAADGTETRSAGWRGLEQPGLFRFAAAGSREVALAEEQPAAQTAAPAVTGLLELAINFELNKPAGAQYRRPYVAIWLEDADEFPVRTAVLWMQTKQPGPRWHRDLLRWFRNDGVRKLADGTDLIGTISSATRGAGQYKAVFDGKDDAGQPLKPGKYTLFIEVAREHGTYQLIRHKLNLGSDPIAETKLKENVEIKSASFEYRTPKPQPAAAAPAKQ